MKKQDKLKAIQELVKNTDMSAGASVERYLRKYGCLPGEEHICKHGVKHTPKGGATCNVCLKEAINAE